MATSGRFRCEGLRSMNRFLLRWPPKTVILFRIYYAFDLRFLRYSENMAKDLDHNVLHEDMRPVDADIVDVLAAREAVRADETALLREIVARRDRITVRQEARLAELKGWRG